MLITIADYELLLNESLDALDTEYVEGVLDVVSEDLEMWLGRTFETSRGIVAEAVQARVVAYGTGVVVQVTAAQSPVIAVTGLDVYLVAGSATALDVSSAMVDGAGTVRVPLGAFGTWRQFFVQGRVYQAALSYTVGAESVPYAIKRAVALLAQEMLNLDAGNDFSAALSGDVAEFRIGDYTEKKATRSLEASRGLGLGSENAVLAARLAGRYKKQGVVLV